MKIPIIAGHISYSFIAYVGYTLNANEEISARVLLRQINEHENISSVTVISNGKKVNNGSEISPNRVHINRY